MDCAPNELISQLILKTGQSKYFQFFSFDSIFLRERERVVIAVLSIPLQS